MPREREQTAAFGEPIGSNERMQIWRPEVCERAIGQAYGPLLSFDAQRILLSRLGERCLDGLLLMPSAASSVARWSTCAVRFSI